MKFSDASGCQTNADKSALYLAGLYLVEEDGLSDRIGIPKGDLPFW